MTYSICRTYRFEASHQLPLLPADHKCFRLHGHNYRVEVEIDGQLTAGMILEFSLLDAYMAMAVLDRLDHHHLNDIVPNPTAENLSFHIYERLALSAFGERIRRVRVYENDDSWAEFKC